MVFEKAWERVFFTLRHLEGPKGNEGYEWLRDLPSGYPVLLYRTTTKRWEGTFKFISVDDDTVVVPLKPGMPI